MTDKITSFNEFIPLALRTESNIDAIKTNKEMLVLLLSTIITMSEVLDAVKKQVFYSNDKKLRSEESFDNILTASSAVDALREMLMVRDEENLSLTDNIEVNPRIFHGLLGTITESGELAEILLNAVMSGEDVDPVHVSEELADSDWYKAITVDELNIDYYMSLTNVIRKLRVRFPDKFSIEDAANRDLKAERIALEGK